MNIRSFSQWLAAIPPEYPEEVCASPSQWSPASTAEMVFALDVVLLDAFDDEYARSAWLMKFRP